MPNLTIVSYRARRLKVERRRRDLERRRAALERRIDVISGMLSRLETEAASLDAIIIAIQAYEKGVAAPEAIRRARPGQHSHEVNSAIVRVLTEAGDEGMARDEIYDALDGAGLLLPGRKSFAPHLSYFGREGKIAFRGGKWYAAEFAPPATGAAMTEAFRLIAAMPGGMTKEEIELALASAGVPFKPKSLVSQLGAQLKLGTLTRVGDRFIAPSADGD